MTQKGQLSEADEAELLMAMQSWETTENIRAAVRQVAVDMVGKSSYREVSRLTGLSTNTLQRWKREAPWTEPMPITAVKRVRPRDE